MSDATSGFPRRDEDGRIVRSADLLGLVLVGVVIGVLALILFDWTFALLGLGIFGQANGWLAVILPAWVFIEEFRAADRGPARWAAAVVAFAVGIAAGLLGAATASSLSPLWSGAAGAAVFSLAYALIWFFGVRWLAHRTG
jgi:hypothetical protein